MIKKFFSRKKEATQQSAFDTATTFQTAMQHHQSGDLEQADILYQQILQHEPNHVDALHFAGVLAHQHGQNQTAIELISKAAQLNPNSSAIYANLGLVFQAQGNLQAAVESYQKAILLQPDFMQAYFNLGNIFHAEGQLDTAIANYQHTIALNPNFAVAHHALGAALQTQGKTDEAITSYRQAIAIQPDLFDACLNLGNLLIIQNDVEQAIECYQKLVALKPDYAEGYCQLAALFQTKKEFVYAEKNYQQAIKIKPDYAEAYYYLGRLYLLQGIFNLAEENYQKAIVIKPNYVEALNDLGLTYHSQNKLDEAVTSFQRAIALAPDSASTYSNLGNVLYTQRKLDLAITNFQKALVLQPDDCAGVRDMLFYSQLHCCDWSTYYESAQEIINAVKVGKPGYHPFSFLIFPSNDAEQLQCAKIFAQNHPPAKTPVWQGQRYQHDKIRIAYLSADFFSHATAFLMAELFELHDKKRFEVTAISFNNYDKDKMRERLLRSFDRFIDVQSMDDYAVAQLLQKLEIDIAIDLKGHTNGGRLGIFAYRPAPIQVNYLAYPGTMGAEYIDYIFADSYVIPKEHFPYYMEKVVYLPESYQVNDSKRVISEQIPTRSEVHLPEEGFVFCCFNNNFKITPDVFAVWMRLLAKVEDSVLWLLQDNPFAVANLQKEAKKHGIAVQRLIFAPRMKLEHHLARHKLADLFLDTLPCNAHTTASDALWAGLPVLTCLGDTFAGRVAASLVNAVGLPELIAHNLEEYEALAIKLATSPDLLTDIRNKLAKNRLTYPLFNTKRFCRHIESAYITMWERHQRGESPMSFAVQPIE
jgi:predicted O-linked N-acetylglucosamine transferase (SPINDLY family)